MPPPPGGDPYLATTSAGAMMLFLPKTSAFIVKGTLSSSTQTYSGSLATSPNRGFLMSSHLGSVGRIVTLGSFWIGKPASLRQLAHPGDRISIAERPTTRWTARLPLIGRSDS